MVRKSELIDHMSLMTGLTKKESANALESALEYIMEKVSQGEDVKIRNFGSFSTVLRKSRTVSNPRTKELIKTNTHYSPKFKPSKAFKEKVDNLEKRK